MGENLKNTRTPEGIKQLIELQAVITVLCSLGYLVFAGKFQALSAITGGVIAIVPNALFARKLFQYRGARAARQIVRGFYLGESIKFLTTLLMFALVFKYFKVYPLALFITYILALMCLWFSPLIVANKLNRPESD